MQCPYCGKQTGVNEQFCPNCGQSMLNGTPDKTMGNYWGKLNDKNAAIAKEERDKTSRMIKHAHKQRRKTIFSLLIVGILIAVGCLGTMKLSKYNEEMTIKMQDALIGKSFTTHLVKDSMIAIRYQYRQLTFKDSFNVAYAYIETTGPAEDNEKPKYKGTYSYTLSRTFWGTYAIIVNGEKYELRTNGEVPTGIKYLK